MTQQQETAWYKQKWPWLVISLPLITVIAGILTYQIASEQPDSLVKDDYFKKGLAINQSLAKLKRAEELGISAQFTNDVGNQLLIVNLNSTDLNYQSQSKQLKLHFSHPTLDKHDIDFILSGISNTEFVAELPELPGAFWHLQLTDEKAGWVVKSRWLFPQDKQHKVNTREKIE